MKTETCFQLNEQITLFLSTDFQESNGQMALNAALQSKISLAN